MDKKGFSLPQIEQEILDFWRKEAIFEKTVAARQDGEPFVFYDGPPFATGLPHYGHILQMAIKDAVLRYKTMQGYSVPRKIGWDCHGLPVEYELEKELSISGKRQIEEYGIEHFVNAARGIVLRYTGEWQKTMERMGRWVDITHPYTTMDNNYIESVWWAFAELYKKELVYKDFRVSPYCPRCGTVLSNFEVNLGYQDNVPDVSVYVTVPVTSEGPFEGVKLILWTTTPWTLPANVALAVNTEATYVLAELEGVQFLVAKDRCEVVLPGSSVVRNVNGKELLGLRYQPLYDLAQTPTAYRVVQGHHVTTEDGTGLVHMAPAYGEDDFIIGKKEELPVLQTVERDGTVSLGKGIPGQGLFVKKADHDIIQDLETRGLLVREEKIKHTYPFCWRCSSPLLYFPSTSWFVNVTAIKDQLIAENKHIEWLPDHLRDGRFGRWLDGARDWAISRDRYWGAPLPVWECDSCGEVKVISSRQEVGVESDFDLHRPHIDTITFVCRCGGTMSRVPFVFDCWFESGSMPYAQHHYPFDNQALFNPHENKGYPADFIAEALDQTRGWFYTLHVLGVALFGKRAYNNVVVSGLLLAPDGKKLSKSLRNYTAPELLFDDQGVDALRLFLFTATSLGEDYRFSDQAVNDVKRRWIVPLLNVLEYYRLSVQEIDNSLEPEPHHALLDEWMHARTNEAERQIIEAMNGNERNSAYDLVRACRTYGPLIEDLSTWYVRLSRGRKDAQFTHSLRGRLLQIAQIYAPFLPFLTEHMYQELKYDDSLPSVHMQYLPHTASEVEPHTVERQAGLLTAMDQARHVVALGRELRAKLGIALKQPLARLEIKALVSDEFNLTDLVAQELQVDTVTVVDEITPGLADTTNGAITVALDTDLTPELRDKGIANNMRRTIQDLRKQAGLQAGDMATVHVNPLSGTVHDLLAQQLQPYTHLIGSGDGQSLGEAVLETDEGPVAIKLYNA